MVNIEHVNQLPFKKKFLSEFQSNYKIDFSESIWVFWKKKNSKENSFTRILNNLTIKFWSSLFFSVSKVFLIVNLEP